MKDEDDSVFRGVRTVVGVDEEDLEEEEEHSLIREVMEDVDDDDTDEEDYSLLREVRGVGVEEEEEDYSLSHDVRRVGFGEVEVEQGKEKGKHDKTKDKEDKQSRRHEETTHEVEEERRRRKGEETEGEEKGWRYDTDMTEEDQWVFLDENINGATEEREEELFLASVVNNEKIKDEAQNDKDDTPLFFSRLPLVGLTGHKALRRSSDSP